jgi:hypothetical protein
MAADAESFLQVWHRIVEKRDAAALADVLAENVTLGAPPYWTRLEGREIVQRLLGIIIETIDGFTYHREWLDGAELALEFTGRVGDTELQGIDLISLDAENRVQNLDVMIRPMNALEELRDRVGARMRAPLDSPADAAG